MTWIESWKEEFKTLGLEEGREEGRQAGRQEGELRGRLIGQIIIYRDFLNLKPLDESNFAKMTLKKLEKEVQALKTKQIKSRH